MAVRCKLFRAYGQYQSDVSIVLSMSLLLYFSHFSTDPDNYPSAKVLAVFKMELFSKRGVPSTTQCVGVGISHSMTGIIL